MSQSLFENAQEEKNPQNTIYKINWQLEKQFG